MEGKYRQSTEVRTNAMNRSISIQLTNACRRCGLEQLRL